MIINVRYLLSNLQITSERSVAQQKANETAQKVELLQKNLMRLQENVLKNNLFANEVSKNAQAVGELANTSDKQAMKLQEEYEKVNKTLIEKSNKSHKSRDKANELKNRAMKLNGDTVHKLQMLNGRYRLEYTSYKYECILFIIQYYLL